MFVVDRIADFAARTPDAPALIAELRPISYRTFDRRIRNLRALFTSLGLPSEGVAVTWIERIPLSWAANLALRSLGLTTVAIRSAAELEGPRGFARRGHGHQRRRRAEAPCRRIAGR